jgi:hypothetical protein
MRFIGRALTPVFNKCCPPHRAARYVRVARNATIASFMVSGTLWGSVGINAYNDYNNVAPYAPTIEKVKLAAQTTLEKHEAVKPHVEIINESDGPTLWANAPLYGIVWGLNELIGWAALLTWTAGSVYLRTQKALGNPTP